MAKACYRHFKAHFNRKGHQFKERCETLEGFSFFGASTKTVKLWELGSGLVYSLPNLCLNILDILYIEFFSSLRNKAGVTKLIIGHCHRTGSC